MDGVAVGQLRDLLAATEAICNNDCFLIGRFNGGHQYAIGEPTVQLLLQNQTGFNGFSEADFIAE